MRKALHAVVGLSAMFGAFLVSANAKAVDCSTAASAGSTCSQAVSSYDPYCTNTAWDSICADECTRDATCTGTTGATTLDKCSGAEDVSFGGVFTGSTSAATADYVPTAAADCGSTEGTGRDVTYKMKFTTSKIVTLSTAGSGFDTLLHVRKGSDSDCTGTQVACNDDGLPGYLSTLTFTAEPNQVYYVVVDGYSSGSSGNYQLRVDTVDPAPPSGETIATSVDVGSDGTMLSGLAGSTIGAAHNYTAACGSSGTAPDRVYKFTLTATKQVTIDTKGSAYDTVLQVMNSSGVNVSGGCNDDNGSGGTWSRITLTLAPGTYYALVDGYNGASGTYTVNFGATDAPPVLFVNGHGKHQSDYVSYWGGTGSSSLPNYVKARTSKNVIVHGYDQTVSLVNAANTLAADINTTFSSAGDNTVDIFAHSAGGLVGRYILSHADDGLQGPRYLAAKKIRKLISDQSPQNGTVLANIVRESGFVGWVGGLMGFDTPMVDDMRTFVQANHGNCLGVTGGCAKIFTIAADGADKGWMNDINTFLGVPVPFSGHTEDWGLMATGAIGRGRDGSFNASDGFIAKASAAYVGTNISYSNANHFHGTRCDYRQDFCNAAIAQINQ